MSDLANRERVNLTINTDLMIKFRARSQSTGVPMSRMIDDAITKIISAPRFLEEKSLIKQVFEFYETIENLSEEQLEKGKIVLNAAWKIFEEKKSSSEGDAVIIELLENKLVYDYTDYSYYLDNPEDVKFCSEALILHQAQDIISTAEEIKSLIK